MPIVTLTTDFGSNSFYAAALKGALYKHIPGVQVVDISNAVPPFDITHAAFLVRNSYPSFPQHTIHLLGVDMDIQRYAQFLLVEYQGQYFIGADNGIFSLIFDNAPVKAYRLKVISPELNDTQWWVQATARLLQTLQVADVAEPTEIKLKKETLKPIAEANSIRGHVVFIDHYKNVITNISKKLFDETSRGRRFRIRFRRTDELDRISTHYNAVEFGERLCLFGDSGFLEIVINRGEAAPLLGLRPDSNIVIDFI